jgi:glycogen debranching enzyme
MKHGMIPNLLDNGNNPRYNCRDACWWFIRGVKEYAVKTKDYEIFKEKVNMIFLSNDLLDHNHLKKEGKTKTMTI